MIQTSKEKLSIRAYHIKLAWLFGCAWISYNPGKDGLEIPDYRRFSKTELKLLVQDLYADFEVVIKIIVKIQNKKQIEKAITWFYSKAKLCLVENQNAPITLCTAQEFEREFGELKVRKEIEVPAYAEILFQGWGGVAIRHPEYMISRDLEFFYFLHQNAENYMEQIDWEKKKDIHGGASENAQSIARATIQSCFALLESFISGIARQHILTSNDITSDLKIKLTDNTQPLKKRIIQIPKLIKGDKPPIDISKPPLSELFGPIKQRRDSFVHCEPGRQDTKWGYIKEEMFNDVSKDVVERSVYYTLELISIIWKYMYGFEHPKWLPQIHDHEKMARRNLNLDFL